MFPALRSTSSESHLSAGRGGIVIKFELQRSKEVELRRVRGEFVSFEEVMTGVTHMWGSSARQIILEYVDEDGDRVRVASQAEWEEAIEQHKTSGAAAFKVFVRRGKKSEPRGRAESRPNEGDSGSDCDATPDVVRVDSPVRPKSPVAVPAAVARPASPMVPPLQLPTPAAVAAEVVAALTQPTVEEDESQQAVVELLSRLYDCDAAREMTNMFSTVDFTPVVKRRLDAVAGEVHVDIDNVAMRHLTIARCNMWIGSRQYEKAEATLRAALEVWPTDKVIEYNIACSASLRGDKVAALGMLEAAVTHGYNDAAQMLADPDLASVRGCGRFKRLVAAARGESETAPGAETPVVPAVATVVAPTPTVAAVTPTPKETSDPVATLLAMFPTMTATQASEVLRKHRGSLAHAASSLL